MILWVWLAQTVRPNYPTMPAISAPMASDAVAAGLGAFNTCSAFGLAGEGDFGFRHRVDQVPDKMLPLFADLVILTAERDDAHLATLAREFGDPIAVEARAVDEEIRRELAAGRLQDPARAVAADAL